MMRQRIQLGVWLSVIMLALPVLAAMFIGLHSRMMSDDYCSTQVDRDLGLIDGLTEQYVTWSGQPLNHLVKNLVGILGIVSIPALSILNFVGFGCAAALSLRALLPPEQRPWQMQAAVGTGAVLALYLLAPRRIESFHWLAALVPYTLPLTLALLMIGIGARQVRRGLSPRLGSLALFGLLSFTAAGFAETYLSTQVGVLVALILICGLYSPLRRPLLPLLAAGLVLSILMAIIIIAAPGNTVRLTHVGFEADLPTVIAATVVGTAVLLVAALVNYSPIALLLVGFSAAYSANRFRWFGRVRHPGRMLAAVGLVVCAGTAGFMGAGAYGMGLTPPARAQVIVAFLFLVGIAASGCIVGSSMKPVPHRWLRGWVVPILCVLAVGTSLYQTIQYVPIVTTFAREWDARDAQLWQASAADTQQVVVAPFSIDLARRLTLETLTADPDYWVNVCAADYYRIDQIIVSEPAQSG